MTSTDPIHDACGAPITPTDVAEVFNFNVGTAIRCLWRTRGAVIGTQDLQDAIAHLQREVTRRQLALDRINGDGEDDDVKPAVDIPKLNADTRAALSKLAAKGFKDVGFLSDASAKALARGTHLHGSVFAAAIPEPVASLIFGGMTTGLSIGPFSAPPARQDAQDSVDRFLTNYTGDACPGCGTSYQDCTRARLTQSSMTIVPGGACCMTCSDGDSHHEREAADRYDAMTKPATQAVPDTVEPRPTTSTDLHTGQACEECGTTYTICSARVKVGQGNCCTHCAFTDAHSVQAIPAVPFPKVHNHGPEDGPGLSCPEATVDGQLRGACLDHIIVRTKPGVRCSCWTWAVPAPCTTSTALISFREHLRGVGAL